MSNLFEKIQSVSMSIMNIEKDMQVGNGSYSYKAVSDLAVTLAVKNAEKENKIVSIPTKQELVSSEIIKTINDKGKEVITYTDVIKMTTKIIDLEDTNSFIEIESFGRGVDSSDKGFGKASTYARKYALLNAYKIATGEDPDAEKSKNLESEKTFDEKDIALKNYLDKNNAVLQNVLSNFNIGCYEDLTKEQKQLTYNKLKSKL